MATAASMTIDYSVSEKVIALYGMVKKTVPS